MRDVDLAALLRRRLQQVQALDLTQRFDQASLRARASSLAADVEELPPPGNAAKRAALLEALHKLAQRAPDLELEGLKWRLEEVLLTALRQLP